MGIDSQKKGYKWELILKKRYISANCSHSLVGCISRVHVGVNILLVHRYGNMESNFLFWKNSFDVLLIVHVALLYY